MTMKFLDFFSNKHSGNTKVLINGFAISLVFVSVFCGYLIHLSEVKESQRNSFSSYVDKAAQLYAALIESQFDNKVQTEKNILFIVQSDEYVKDVFVVNKFAGVVAPISKAYQVIQDSDLDALLVADSDAKFMKNNSSGRVYLPLFDEQKKINAVVVVSFAMTESNILKSQLGMFLFIFLVIASAVIFMTKKINNAIEKPWEDLALEVEDALNGSPLKAPAVEVSESLVDKHHFLYFRLLSKLGHGKSKE